MPSGLLGAIELLRTSEMEPVLERKERAEACKLCKGREGVFALQTALYCTFAPVGVPVVRQSAGPSNQRAAQPYSGAICCEQEQQYSGGVNGDVT
jgi:hypothetical protein